MISYSLHKQFQANLVNRTCGVGCWLAGSKGTGGSLSQTYLGFTFRLNTVLSTAVYQCTKIENTICAPAAAALSVCVLLEVMQRSLPRQSVHQPVKVETLTQHQQGISPPMIYRQQGLKVIRACVAGSGRAAHLALAASWADLFFTNVFVPEAGVYPATNLRSLGGMQRLLNYANSIQPCRQKGCIVQSSNYPTD